MTEMKSSTCPYVVKGLSHAEDALIKKYYSKNQNEYVRFGEIGCLLPPLYQDHAAAIKEMPLRPNDTIVVTFPRSGTTWTQELVWLLSHDLDYNTARSKAFNERTVFLEHTSFENPAIVQNLAETNKNDPEFDKLLKLLGHSVLGRLADAPSPRNMKSHLPLSLLPEGSLNTMKIIYVARDPRDVMVSCYHFYKDNVFFQLDSNCSFKEFFNMFIEDLVPWAPYFEHVKEAWAQRHHPNILFLFYEELSQDLNATVRRVAEFLGKQYSDEQFDELCEFLSFENCQRGDSFNLKSIKHLVKKFIRQGKAGGWRDVFDDELKARAQRWMDERLSDTDLRFPEHPL